MGILFLRSCAPSPSALHPLLLNYSTLNLPPFPPHPPFPPYPYHPLNNSTLPTFLGGTCRCTLKGGCICGRPNALRSPAPEGGPKEASVLVPARDHLDVLLTAREPNSLLRYEFSVEAQGVEFSALLTPDEEEGGGGGGKAGGEVLVLVPLAKRKAGEGKVKGEVVVPHAGLVTVRFGNEYSFLTGKQLTGVTISVEAPSETLKG